VQAAFDLGLIAVPLAVAVPLVVPDAIPPGPESSGGFLTGWAEELAVQLGKPSIFVLGGCSPIMSWECLLHDNIGSKRIPWVAI
jgi:hypothetical protein